MDQRRELQGWDEIASFLGVRIRAAQNYEKERGLPIHRLPGGHSRVFAFTDELDAWKINDTSANNPAPLTANGNDLVPAAPTGPTAALQLPQTHPASQPRRRDRHIVYTIAAVGVLTLGVAIGLLYPRSRVPTGPPTDLWVRDKTLIVNNAKGEELWRHSFPESTHPGSYLPVPLLRYAWFGDIDGDGKTELLFLYKPINDIQVGTPVYCFSEDGKVKWKYLGGYATFHDSITMTGIYLSWIKVLPKRRQLLVMSNHSMSSPQQVALLDSSGKVLGEYWHHGHLLYIDMMDVDGDGEEEALLAGVDNHHNKATLVVLPLKDLPAPINPIPLPQLEDLYERGGESATVLFPHSCITKTLSPFNRAFRVRVTSVGIEVAVFESYTEAGGPPYLIYLLSPKLELLSLIVSDDLESAHKRLEAEGKLDHAFSRGDEAAELKRELVVRWK